MSKKRKRYSADFKAKPWQAPLKIEETTAEQAQRFGVHPTKITTWKRALFEGFSGVLDKNRKTQKQTDEAIDELYRQISRLKVENDFFIIGIRLLSRKQRRQMISRGDGKPGLSRKCQMLKSSCSSAYYKTRPVKRR